MRDTTYYFTNFRLLDTGRALLMGQTLKRHNPRAQLWALVCDRNPPGFRLPNKNRIFDVVTYVDDLGLPAIDVLLKRYAFDEISAQAEAALLSRLKDAGADKIVFLSPHVAVFDELGGECLQAYGSTVSSESKLEIRIDGDIFLDGSHLKLMDFGEKRAPIHSKHQSDYQELCCWYDLNVERLQPTGIPKHWWFFYRIPTWYGLMRTFGEEDLISQALKDYGAWSGLEVEFLSQFIEPESRIFDIGAFIGTFTLGLYKSAPFGWSLSVEVNPNAFELLTHNLDFCLETEHSTELAIVGPGLNLQKTKKGYVAYADPKNWGVFQFHPQEPGQPDLQKFVLNVPAITLEALRKKYRDYDLLKLDVEGMELDVLESDAQWINRNKPLIWLECNEENRAFYVLDFLFGHGYDVYYFAFPAYDPARLPHSNLDLHVYCFETGLLATTNDKKPRLSEELARRGCFLQRLNSRLDLRRALWKTPRFAQGEWEGLSQFQLGALLGRQHKNETFATFFDEFTDNEEVVDTNVVTTSHRIVKKPNCFIVGAPKCGTTSMYHYLGQHPEVFMPAIKEPNFFAQDLDIKSYPEIDGLSSYLELYDGSSEEKILGDASQFHLYSRVAAQKIHGFSPEAKVIIMLRSPISMIRSLHRQYLSTHDEDVENLALVIQIEEERLTGKKIPRGTNFPRCMAYLDLACFAGQVGRFYQLFHSEAIKVVLLDDLKENTQLIYEDTLDFLGVTKPFLPDYTQQNVGSPLPEIDEHLHTFLHNYFLPEIEALENILKRDLSCWKINSSFENKT